MSNTTKALELLDKAGLVAVIYGLTVVVILIGVALVAWFWIPMLPSSVYVAAAFLGGLWWLMRAVNRRG